MKYVVSRHEGADPWDISILFSKFPTISRDDSGAVNAVKGQFDTITRSSADVFQA
jgi:hypothetical protein